MTTKKKSGARDDKLARVNELLDDASGIIKRLRELEAPAHGPRDLPPEVLIRMLGTAARCAHERLEDAKHLLRGLS